MLSTAPKPANDVAAASASGGDLRSATRYPASAVPAITGLRISPHGVEATLVNISESGVLAECGERLKPGSAVTVVFEGTFVPRSMEGRVARNSVSSMGRDGRLRYHVGISFGRPIDLGIVPEPEPVPEPAPTMTAAALAPQASEAPPAPPAPAAASAAAPAPPMVEFEITLPTGNETVRNRW
jgi:PilZ domain-containing protein